MFLPHVALRSNRSGSGFNCALQCFPSLTLGKEWRAVVVAAQMICAVTVMAGQAAPSADLSLGRVVAKSAASPRADGYAHYSAALQFENAGRMREALRHYQQAALADPGNADLAFHTAELALNYDTRAAAMKVLEDCIKASPGTSAPAVNLARFLATYPGDDPFEPDRATKVLNTALTKFPEDATLYRETVIIYLARNLHEEAVKALDLAARQTTSDPDFWLETGRSAQQVWPLNHPDFKEQHRAKVNPFFEKALGFAQSRADVELAVAKFYLLSNQLEKAAKVAEALTKRTANPEAMKLLVRLYQTLDREEDSMNLLEELLKATPSDVEQRRLLIGMYERKEQFEKAVPHAEALIQAAGGDASDYMNLSRLLLLTRQTEKALQLAKRTLALFPNNPRFTLQAAWANRAMKLYNESLRFYEKTETLALAMAPDLLNDRFYQSWGDTLQGMDKYDDAAQKYQKSIALVPQDDPTQAAVVLNNLGYMWLDQGKNLDQAGEFIRKANQLSPKNPVYLDSLGWFHFKKGNYPEALKVLEEVESAIKEPGAEDAEIFDHIGQIHVKLGNKARALEYFKKASGLDPTAAKIREHYEKAK
ncbi:MAG: hypothetical protein JWO89_606 [Verrucomicrobiaceae bacterium]|nr:hypothetical protein [Verrucomicrobiaceae bacterium]